jgi:hypothetical protein
MYSTPPSHREFKTQIWSCQRNPACTPRPPKGGAKFLYINKSPLGDLGVKIIKKAFKQPHSVGEFVAIKDKTIMILSTFISLKELSYNNVLCYELQR